MKSAMGWIAVSLLSTGCATGASSSMGLALDYVRAVEQGDPNLYAQAVDREKYEYLAPRPGHPREPLVLKFDAVQAALQSFSRHGAPDFSTLQFSERSDGSVDVTFALTATSRREKVEQGGTFKVESGWRLTFQDSVVGKRISRVEELAPRGHGGRSFATFGHVQALHSGDARALSRAQCRPEPCEGVEYADAAGRVLVKEIWKVTQEGTAAGEPPRIVDGEGKSFANYDAAR